MKKILIVFAIVFALAVAESEEARPEEDEGYEFHEPMAARVKRWSKTIPRKPKREAVVKDDDEGIVEEFDDTPIEQHPQAARAKRTSKTHKHGERPKRQAVALAQPPALPAPIVPGPAIPPAQPAPLIPVPAPVQTQETQPANTQEVIKQEKQDQMRSETQPEALAQQPSRGKRNEIETFERVKRGVA